MSFTVVLKKNFTYPGPLTRFSFHILFASLVKLSVVILHPFVYHLREYKRFCFVFAHFTGIHTSSGFFLGHSVYTPVQKMIKNLENNFFGL